MHIRQTFQRLGIIHCVHVLCMMLFIASVVDNLVQFCILTGIILGMHPANEGWPYIVTSSLTGLVHSRNHPSSDTQYHSRITHKVMSCFLVTSSRFKCYISHTLSLSSFNHECSQKSNLQIKYPCRMDRLTGLYINGLMQERRSSMASALELCLPCTNPSICSLIQIHRVGGIKSYKGNAIRY